MPPVRPLTREEWREFMVALERGPTPEQARTIEESKEICRHVRVRDSSTMKIKTRRLRPQDVERMRKRRWGQAGKGCSQERGAPQDS